MNYGLYLSASGVLTSMYRQDVLANNLANVETAGFKPHLPTVRQRSPEAVEDDLGYEVSQRLLDRLGGGALAGPGQYDFSVGPMQHTAQPLDIALTQRDQFFAIRNDTAGPEPYLLTRDARLTVDGLGQLVTASGHAILDHRNRVIELDPQVPVEINGQGQVSQDGNIVAQTHVVQTKDLGSLRPIGGNRFTTDDNFDQLFETVDVPNLKVGFVEQSGVDAVQTMTRMIEAARAIQWNAKLMQYNDQMTQQAVTTLGRVA